VPASGVSAVVLNVAVTAPTANGWIAAYADQSTYPGVANLNFVKGQTISNLVIAPVSAAGKVDLKNGSAGTVQLVADISGYIRASDQAFVPGAVNIVVPYGKQGSLPGSVVLSLNGMPQAYPVQWPTLNSQWFTQPGTHTVTGQVPSLGEAVRGIVTVGQQGQTLNVAAMGDSITYGLGTTDPSLYSYPAQLQEMLGGNFNVTDFGKPGAAVLPGAEAWGAFTYTAQPEYTASLASSPNVVLLQFADNDVRGDMSALSGFVAAFQALVRKYMSLPSHPVVYVEIPPVVFPPGNYSITEANLDQAIALIFQAMSTPEFANVTIIDNHTLTKNSAAQYSADFIHPDNVGALQLAVNVRMAILGDAHIAHSGTVQATSFTNRSGGYLASAQDGSAVTVLQSLIQGGWLSISNATLSGAPSASIQVRLAVLSAGTTTMTVRAGSASGQVLATVSVGQSNNLGVWKTVPVTLTNLGSTASDLYFTFTQPASTGQDLVSVEWVKLS
jgi:hypothetical protein